MTNPKLTPDHLRRKAIIYIRQSTPTQVLYNRESQRRQYGLADYARSLGFEEVATIDDDLGRSGCGLVERPGFEHLVAEICAEQMGAVLCIEASRLARNGRDWHHLIELCGLVNALVIDPEGMYDPRLINDRLLLGLRGTMKPGHACKAAPTYAGLVKTTRQALVNVTDETGWRVGGQLQWMHVAVSAQVTVYAILPGRGYEQSRLILGADYDAFQVHDGWAPYYRFVAAFHQSCLRHLLVRCQEMAQIASTAAAASPLAVKDLLQASLQLRDRYQEAEISEHGLRTATGRLEAQLDRLLEKPYRDPANRRLAKHLQHERPFLFTFLYCPGLDATNHEAERAVRWMVIARKVWGGNRTWDGAQTQQILVSVLRTCWQQDKDPFPRLISLLCSRGEAILDIVPGAG